MQCTSTANLSGAHVNRHPTSHQFRYIILVGMPICRPTPALLLFPLLAWSEPAADELFAAKVLPILQRDCEGCHGASQTLSKLDVRSRESLLRGGARGPALVPGKADSSLLLHVLQGRNQLQMPPGGDSKKLPPETIAAFRDWIDAGAPWPQAASSSNWDYKDEDLWAFKPLRAFNRAKRLDDFLQAAARADRRSLIRRATIGLTGLPPTPDDVDAFLTDKSPNAWERVIDRLLASPRYGEHWARHWLDVARYADTSGYSNDYERPNAWRYRDYVIRAFNNDKPYDRFILEQIAGDELFPSDPEALIATGFLRSGPWEHTAMSVEAVTRQIFLDDVTHNTAATFLGLTVGCARCHDHKFDPIPTRDYYRMQAVFATTEFARPKVPFLAHENTADIPVGAAHIRKIYEQARARMQEYRKLSALELMKKQDLAKGELERAVNAGEGLTPEQYEEFKLFQKHSQLYQESLDRFEPKAFAVSSGPLDGFTDGGVALRYPNRGAYKPAAVHILPGGNIQSPAEPVTTGVLSALERYGAYPAPAIPETVEGRRSALAKWIANPKNPLTARVMVNRVWQYHFGTGIAADTSNFGKMGKKPSNPELLDHLANAFIEGGWSIRKLHRLILLSDAYRSAAVSPRRVDAEVLRDSILSVAGELSSEAGGPGVFPEINDYVARQPQHRMGSLAPAYRPSPLKRQRNRRSIYTFQQRSLIDPMIEVFNGPTLDLQCERREASTIPTQAFALFNSAFTHDMALAFAARLEKEAPDLDGRVRRAFRLAYAREPEPAELRLAKQHVQKMTAHHNGTPPPPKAAKQPIVHQITSELTGESFRFVQQEDPAEYEPNLHPSQVGPETRALADLALVLLNSNEFVYVY